MPVDKRLSFFALFISPGSCNQSLNGSYGSFNSPNYPNNYPHNQNCFWTISVPYGNHVSLEFLSFSVEYWSGCPYDFVEIRDGSSASSPVLGKYCGTAKPPTIVSTSNSMLVNFHSDHIKVDLGFSAQFSAVKVGE